MPKIIGITGSIGMGKSTIASMLSKIRIPVFDSDKEVARILKENNKIINDIGLKWPIAVTKKNNATSINKKILGDIVFRNVKDKVFLEKLLHPIVQKQRELFIKNHKNSHLIALDVPLLFETKTHNICHYIFLAEANGRTQRTRVLSRPHMTNAKFELIKKNQLSNEERLRLSSKIFVITTNYGKLVSFIIILSCLFKILLKKEGKKT